jgi:PHD/YefM family antitoxin component YafN of YafNO toxin-antitoxin module
MKTIAEETAREHLDAVLDEVPSDGVAITRPGGKPHAVILPRVEYECRTELEDAVWAARLQASASQHGPSVGVEESLRWIHETLARADS